jgi:hypothetical protein
MALTIGQTIAMSYNAVLNGKRAENQWSESAFLRALEAAGGIRREDLGAQIEVTLDYQANPNGIITATDLATVSLNKTEILTAAVFDISEIIEPITWSTKDEVMNSGRNKKVDRATVLMENGIESHDDKVERALLTTTTGGFLGLGTHVTAAGTGSDGGIDSGTNAFWRNQQATYADDTDIEAAFTTVYNACAKGSGSTLVPTIMVSDGATQAIFEGTQQALQRWESQDLKAGFKALMFKTAKYVFSQYGTTSVYFINTKNFNAVVSKGHFRERQDVGLLENAAGSTMRIYTAGQSVTNNRSRLGVAHL